MSDETDEYGFLAEEEFPDLGTEDGRDTWAEILMQQDDDTLTRNETGWVKCLTISDGENMVARFVYPYGTEEVFDLIVRRSIAVVSVDDSTRN